MVNRAFLYCGDSPCVDAHHGRARVVLAEEDLFVDGGLDVWSYEDISDSDFDG